MQLPEESTMMTPTPSDASVDDESRQPSSPRSPPMQKELFPTAAWDVKKVAACYFVVVFLCRLFLRSPLATAMNWAVVMVLEDGLSSLSFMLALMYLCQSNGAPLAALAGRLGGARAEGAFGDNSSGSRTVRLFYFAL
eukprot:TRINITY_DN103959_c0_g1_i1.p1 TRINITY_DN103959_c0_g1~~TRINITY_DN103959_c0_g1_i1.p1  ORF type:complete len:138 (-),score=23.74 TRINITY_DN103959_c0_g1_i1:34-447(-)